jgi:tRNA pseudouridine13 synthase
MKMMFIHGVQSYIWNHMASARIAKYGFEHVIEGEFVLLSSSEHSQLSNEFGDSSDKVPPDVHVVTADDVMNKRYIIRDVVLPLMGSKTMEP